MVRGSRAVVVYDVADAEATNGIFGRVYSFLLFAGGFDDVTWRR